MNKRILIITLTAICGGASAQPKNAYCPTPNSRDAGTMAVVDTTRIRVWYAFNADNVKDVNTYIDQQRLDIGKRVTKYYSDFLFRSDSLIGAWAKSILVQGQPRVSSAMEGKNQTDGASMNILTSLSRAGN